MSAATPRERVFITARKLRLLKDELMLMQEPEATTIRFMALCDHLADALIDLQVQIEAQR